MVENNNYFLTLLLFLVLETFGGINFLKSSIILRFPMKIGKPNNQGGFPLLSKKAQPIAYIPFSK